MEYTTMNNEKKSRYFINISSCGLGGIVASETNESTKMFGGFLTFLGQTCKHFVTWKDKKIKYKIGCNDNWRSIDITHFVIANGQYHGGGMHIAPEAEMDDGLFDIIIINNVGFTDLGLFKRLYDGKHLRNNKVFHTKTSVVQAKPYDKLDDIMIELDGESGGKLPARWSVIKGAVNMIVS